MPNEFSFEHLPHSPEREAYTVSYDELSKKATIHVRGTKFVLDGVYEKYAAAMRAAHEFSRGLGLKL